VIEIRETDAYSAWFASLRDHRAQARINIRIGRLRLGNPGDTKSVGEGVRELRIDYGPGYRVYYVQRGPLLIILLGGGQKRTQDRDIRNAQDLAKNWRD
jgi:putative addiction module killer protein